MSRVKNESIREKCEKDCIVSNGYEDRIAEKQAY